MYGKLLTIGLFLILFACQKNADHSSHSGKLVSTPAELYDALKNAKAGDEIVLANGTWKDVEIVFTGKGTKDKPIILRAETPGEVFIEGKSNLKFGGDYLEVHDLFFRNGHTPSGAVVEFRMDENQVASHCRFTNCVIRDYNQSSRDQADHWVEFWGRHNELSHCYIAGKSNHGPTVRIQIKGNQSIYNYHQIIHNHFGPRPRKGGPSSETIQIGDSETSMSPSYTNVSNNLFERCNGEVEVISSKTNYNEFRNNIFYKCEGSLVTRHGNYCIIDGNYFIGDENQHVGGVRLINTGHWVTNNYFFNLKGEEFRSPLAVMNGIPKAAQNRYNQVTDVVVAHNTWVNCTSPWHFGVGSNISQKDVLPPSEIRSETPERTIVANNLIYHEKGDAKPIVAHDKIDGIAFKNNVINNQGVAFEKVDGLEPAAFEMEKAGEYVFYPKGLENAELYAGFEFEKIEKDIFGNPRSGKNIPGAMCQPPADGLNILDKKKYGPAWYSDEVPETTPQVLSASAEANDLASKIAEAKNGDIVELAGGTFSISNPLAIDKKITIQSKDANNPAQIIYNGAPATPAFEMHPRGHLILKNVKLSGEKKQYAFASLKENMSSLYNLSVSNCEISDFDFVLKAYKNAFAEEIAFSQSVLKNCQNGIELSAETDDKGDYNAEFLTVDSCRFENIKSNVIDYYRGGYDESTIGGNLLVTNSAFSNCGAREANGILINTRGIINVSILKNTFKNNPVKLVALLWGAKNNTHSGNEIISSGKIVVEENLKLKVIY